MKKLLMFLQILFIGMFLLSCSTNAEGGESNYMLSYVSEYSTAPESVLLGRGYLLKEENLPQLYNSYYEFNGWYLNGIRIVPGYAIKSNTVLKARWIPRIFTLSFSSNGGSGNMSSKHIEYGAVEYLPKCTFTPPLGKYFAGWGIFSVQEEATYDDCAEYIMVSSRTLYAIWKENATHSIYYDVGEGVLSENAQTEFYESRYITIDATATREGYVFDGWYLNPECIGNAISSWSPASYQEDVYLYAKWKSTMESAITILPFNDIKLNFEESGESITITVDGTYTDYCWQVDNVVQSEKTGTFVLYTQDLLKGVYEIYVQVQDGTLYKSSTAFVKVGF